jgi:chemotaxis protein methyltransferase CheR
MSETTNRVVEFFAGFIEKELGIVYSESNFFQLKNRLDEITKMRQLKSVDELLAIAEKSMPSDLKQLVLDVATNNETSFFRDAKLFQAIKNEVIPDLAQAGGQQPLRVWSAACSSGQEPYTLAMLLSEFAEVNQPGLRFEIFASDISSRILAKARAARYSQLEVQRGLPANLMIKYFTKDADDYWTLKKPLQDRVRFERFNLLDSFAALASFDLILCRNVLIYQNVENKKRIIKKLASLLKPTSYLVLGSGESMIGLCDDFESVKFSDALVYRLKKSSQKLTG